MSESHESSYYEIALTHGQVGVTFVVFLGALIAAFLAGVWVGKGRSPEVPGEIAAPTVAEATGPELEEFKFFSEDGAATTTEKTNLRSLLEAPDPSSTLAEDLGVSEPPPKQLPVIESQPAEKPAEKPVEKPSSPPPTRSGTETAPPVTAGVEGGDWVIQVLSTGDQAKADQLLARLRAGGFSAFLSPAEMQGQAMYRVRVGPFSERSAAEKVADTVKRRYRVDTWITH